MTDVDPATITFMQKHNNGLIIIIFTDKGGDGSRVFAIIFNFDIVKSALDGDRRYSDTRQALGIK